MNSTVLRMSAVMAALVTVSSADAQPQQIQCAPEAVMLQNLASQFQEKPAFSATDERGAVTITISPSGSWTLLLRPAVPTPVPMVCIIAGGASWGVFNEPKPAEPEKPAAVPHWAYPHRTRGV